METLELERRTRIPMHLARSTAGTGLSFLPAAHVPSHKRSSQVWRMDDARRR